MQQQSGPSTRALGSRYLLEQVIGSGAMGQVWRAVDQRTGEPVAAKLLRAELVEDPDIVTRFLQERSILLTLTHPHIVRVRDLVVEGDDLALVMDLVTGSDLRRYLRGHGTLPAKAAAALTVDIFDALAAAHAHGVLHRDVKPDNVLLDAVADDPTGGPDVAHPFVRLSDFGIARLAQETTVRLTGVLGTAEYIAPEIFTSEVAGPAADVYSAGVVLYELLAGRSPFAGGVTAYAVAHRHVTSTPPALPGLPAGLNDVLDSLLAKDPATRPTATAAAARLRELLGSLGGVAALPVQQPPASWSEAAAGFAVQVHGAPTPAPGELDPQRTALRGELRAPTPAGPVEAEPARTPPAGPPATDPGQTLLPDRPRRAQGGLDTLDVPAAAAPVSHRRRTLILAAGAAVLVAGAVATGVTLSGGKPAAQQHHGPAAVHGPATVTETSDPQRLPSGLDVQRSGQWDPSRRLLTVTVSYTAPGPGRWHGPFAEVVPAPSGSGCAAVRPVAAGGGGGSLHPDPVDLGSCGYQVRVPALQPGAAATVSYAVPLAPSGDAAAAVTDYLGKIDRATMQRLAGIGDVDVFPAQRLTGLSVQIDGSVHLQSRLQAIVHPAWLGSTRPDRLTSLYHWGDAPANPTVRALGAPRGVQLSINDTKGCQSVLARHGGDWYVEGAANDRVGCELDATLGQLSGSTLITVAYRGAG